MRRMFSEKQIKGIVKESPSEVVEALKGQDISVEGITSKGIANTGNVGITGDLAVSGSINGEENPSVKPIYIHPITLVNGNGGTYMRATVLLFNNDPTPLTKYTFIDFIDNLYTQVGETIRIMSSGTILDNDNVYILSYFGKSTNGYYFAGNNINGAISQTITFNTEQLLNRITDFFDGVNKIN